MKNALILLIGLALFAACKKYPEGGFTKRGPKNIIGVWKLSLYEVNGVDSTNLINYNNNENYKVFNIQKNASTISIGSNGGATSLQFANNNMVLIFEGNGKKIECTNFNNINYCYRSYLTPEAEINNKSTTWKIDKLKSNELILLLNQKNKYKLIFNK